MVWVGRGRGEDAARAHRLHFYETAGDDPEALEIWCYCDRPSYAPGETLRLHVSTTAPRYDLTIRRDGAAPETVYRAAGLAGRHHPTPEDCAAAGCGWPVAHALRVPADWRSGGYLVEVRARGADGAEAVQHHLFVLRAAPGRAAPLLLVAATCTWTAYNDWGGANHYEGTDGPSPRLSLLRPQARGFARLPAAAPRVVPPVPPPPDAPLAYPHMAWAYERGYSKKYASAGWASYERPFAHWAEEAGYAVDVASLVDLHLRPEILDAYRCVVFVGHDEYWSWEMRDGVERYLAAGGRVARLAGNFMWQVRLADAGLTQICHKYRARRDDPLYGTRRQARTTTSWEAPEVGRPAAATFGLNALRGLYAGWGGCSPRGARGFTVYRPGHWAFDGTGLTYGDLLGAGAGIFGYEVDGLDYGLRDGLPHASGADGAPAGLEILALGLASPFEADRGRGGAPFIGAEDAEFVAETLHGAATPETLERVKHGNGMIVEFPFGEGRVFHAGTCEWVAGLIARDPQVERTTRNVLERFGA